MRDRITGHLHRDFQNPVPHRLELRQASAVAQDRALSCSKLIRTAAARGPINPLKAHGMSIPLTLRSIGQTILNLRSRHRGRQQGGASSFSPPQPTVSCRCGVPSLRPMMAGLHCTNLLSFTTCVCCRLRPARTFAAPAPRRVPRPIQSAGSLNRPRPRRQCLGNCHCYPSLPAGADRLLEHGLPCHPCGASLGRDDERHLP